MRYPADAVVRRHAAPRLIGCYEQCLHPVIQYTNTVKYERIVDIGCAEGYYAVGLARLHPEAIVYAFETDHRELRLCREMAAINHAGNIVFQHFCDAASLLDLVAARRCLIVCDCEGFEEHLFTKATGAAMPNADFIIELHEEASAGLTERVCAAFSDRRYEVIRYSTSKPDVLPSLAETLGSSLAEMCVSEHRSAEQQWLWAPSSVRC